MKRRAPSVVGAGSAPSSPDAIVDRLDARLHTTGAADTPSVRHVRRELSRELHDAPPALVRAVAFALTARDRPFDRFIAAELLAAHPGAIASLGRDDLRLLGRGMDSWGDVDVFACYVAGPAWRSGRVSDAEVKRWARSPDAWWRRAALASTVPLNNRARGGSGDAARTLMVCHLALDDREPLVMKALSWALRELAKRDPASVARFLDEHEPHMPALVRREVRNKLRTGKKAPARGR